MCFEKHVEEPAREVSVKIEQQNVSGIKQLPLLAEFAMGLADRLFGKGDRDPVPKPDVKEVHGNEFYIINFSGVTRMEPKDLKEYFRDERPIQAMPYTTVDINYENPKTQFYIKSKP